MKSLIFFKKKNKWPHQTFPAFHLQWKKWWTTYHCWKIKDYNSTFAPQNKLITFGLGTAIIALIGILLFKELVSSIKVLSIVIIIAGVIGLNLANGLQNKGGKEKSIQQIYSDKTAE